MNTKKFYIHTLLEKNHEFFFDINQPLKNFRTRIICDNVSYSLINSGRICVYDNDDGTKIFKELLELSHPELLLSSEIHFYLTMNYGFPRKREGKFLISKEKQNIIEKKFLELNCPINLTPIQYAIKINNRFYELEEMANYLSNELNKIFVDGNYQIICPFRTPINKSTIIFVLSWHYKDCRDRGIDIPSDGKIKTVNKSSVQICLWYMPSRQNDQKEYNEKLLEIFQA
jgi:hypothetical protein